MNKDNINNKKQKERKDRLAAQLRSNLFKRKKQARQRLDLEKAKESIKNG